MVDTSSLVVAVVSLVGTIIVAGVTILFQYFSDERKRLTETDKLVRKYRDPVLWAANELQSRFYNICDKSLLDFYDDPSRHDLIVVYTAYLVGQYLSWTSIFRRQAQFLSFASQAVDEHKRLNDLLVTISDRFLTSRKPFGNSPFMLWRGQQFAIGEIMTVRDEGGEMLCMGYATFLKKWNAEEEFRKWFMPIEQGMNQLLHADRAYEPPTLRIVCLQHLLYDLLCLLDPNGLQWNKDGLDVCRLKEDNKKECKCRSCKGEVSKKALNKNGEV